jgi:hypothetical protein
VKSASASNSKKQADEKSGDKGAVKSARANTAKKQVDEKSDGKSSDKLISAKSDANTNKPSNAKAAENKHSQTTVKTQISAVKPAQNTSGARSLQEQAANPRIVTIPKNAGMAVASNPNTFKEGTTDKTALTEFKGKTQFSCLMADLSACSAASPEKPFNTPPTIESIRAAEHAAVEYATQSFDSIPARQNTKVSNVGKTKGQIEMSDSLNENTLTSTLAILF